VKAVISTKPDTGKLACLQAGRAVAALLVMLYHNSLYIFILDKYWGYDPSQGLFKFTHAGVEFFFVLSGFIILSVHWKDIGHPERCRGFLRKRFIRIYPMYWLLLALIIPLYFLVPSFGFPYHRELGTILSSILLVYKDGNMYSELAVAWTLYHEILFYAVFALAIWNRRMGLVVMALWLLASLLSVPVESPVFPLSYLASPLHALFGMGMAACWILQRRAIPLPRIVALAGFMLFLSTALADDGDLLPENVLDLSYGLGSMLMVLGLVELERQGRLYVPRLLQLMGDASYAIYLTHFTVLSLCAKMFIRFGAREMLPDFVSFVLLLVPAILFGIALHLLVERPLLRRLSQTSWRQTASSMIHFRFARTTP
jgi:exopolysaccharide production protein ExoZ